jgi:rod shape-determining protein MreD
LTQESSAGPPRLGMYALLILFFFAEFTILNKLRIFGTRPELLLIVTVFFGFHFGAVRGAEFGIISGLLKDIFSINTFGVNALFFLVIGGLSGFLREKIAKESVFLQFLFSGLAAYILSAIFYNLREPGLIKGLYTGCAAPVIFFALGRMFKAEEA